MSPTVYEANRHLLTQRFPELAARLATETAGLEIAATAARDGGVCYAARNGSGDWRPLTNPVDPIAKAQAAARSMEHRLSSLAPAVVVGLAPGYELDILAALIREAESKRHPIRRVYVIVHAFPCLDGWLQAADRTEILQREEVEFYAADTVDRIVRLCEEDEQRSYLFLPLSSLPSKEWNRIIDPLARLYRRREAETKELQAANNAYYDAITDEQLGAIIAGETNRKPRLLFPAHTSSTVVKYSARDTCEAFEEMGWETRIFPMDRDLPPWRMVKAIHDFKPDVLISVNHLRTEDTERYPRGLMFITWVQDTCPYINNREAAAEWNAMVAAKEADG